MPVSPAVKAGKIAKPYGLRGELIIILEPEMESYLKAGNPLFVEMDGQRVPFFLEEAEIASESKAIVKFEWVDSMEEAREICGCPVFPDPAGRRGKDVPEDDGAKVVGYRAEDERLGKLGQVTEFLVHDMNPVWVVDMNGKELMIPAAQPFIRQIDHSGKIITFRLPEGLTEL